MLQPFLAARGGGLPIKKQDVHSSTIRPIVDASSICKCGRPKRGDAIYSPSQKISSISFFWLDGFTAVSIASIAWRPIKEPVALLAVRNNS